MLVLMGRLCVSILFYLLLLGLHFHDLIVEFGRKNAHQRHHSHHGAIPSGLQPVKLCSIGYPMRHIHPHVLRIAGHLFLLRIIHWIHHVASLVRHALAVLLSCEAERSSHSVAGGPQQASQPKESPLSPCGHSLEYLYQMKVQTLRLGHCHLGASPCHSPRSDQHACHVPGATGDPPWRPSGSSCDEANDSEACSRLHTWLQIPSSGLVRH